MASHPEPRPGLSARSVDPGLLSGHLVNRLQMVTQVLHTTGDFATYLTRCQARVEFAMVNRRGAMAIPLAAYFTRVAPWKRSD